MPAGGRSTFSGSMLALRGGHGGLRYCGIELFFKRYFGDFDFYLSFWFLILVWFLCFLLVFGLGY